MPVRRFTPALSVLLGIICPALLAGSSVVVRPVWAELLPTLSESFYKVSLPGTALEIRVFCE